MTTNKNEPAFPTDVRCQHPSEYSCRGNHPTIYSGISIRDYFAAKAMQGMLASPKLDTSCINKETLAECAFMYADAMLAERNKERGE